MKIAVCDDDREFAENLKSIIDNYYNTQQNTVCIFNSPTELLDALEQDSDRFSGVFLDIEMPNLNGIQAAKHIRKSNSEVDIIFLTSHIEMAMEGYEVNALRFLGKPINEAKLYEVLALLDKSPNTDKNLVINDGGSTILVKHSEILYIKAENVYVNIVTQNKNYLLRKKFVDIENELDNINFVRIHRSYIVNLEYISSFDGKSVILTDGTNLPLSRSCEKQFKDAVMNYLRRFN